MIKNLVFDLGNVLIEWNPDKIFRHFEADEMRRQSLREAILSVAKRDYQWDRNCHLTVSASTLCI